MVRAGGGGGGGSPPRWASVTFGNNPISNSAGSVVARRHRCRRGVNASVRCRMANLLTLGLFDTAARGETPASHRGRRGAPLINPTAHSPRRGDPGGAARRLQSGVPTVRFVHG